MNKRCATASGRKVTISEKNLRIGSDWIRLGVLNLDSPIKLCPEWGLKSQAQMTTMSGVKLHVQIYQTWRMHGSKAAESSKRSRHTVSSGDVPHFRGKCCCFQLNTSLTSTWPELIYATSYQLQSLGQDRAERWGERRRSIESWKLTVFLR